MGSFGGWAGGAGSSDLEVLCIDHRLDEAIPEARLNKQHVGAHTPEPTVCLNLTSAVLFREQRPAQGSPGPTGVTQGLFLL